MTSKFSRNSSAGFTLVEVLVVLVIMGLFASLVTPVFYADEAKTLKLEAKRLRQLLVVAQSESRLSAQSIAWVVDRVGYRFMRKDINSNWLEITNNDVLRPRLFSEGVRVSKLTIDSVSSLDSFRLELPHHGQLRPFSIELSFGEARTTLVSNPLGEIRISQESGMDHASERAS